MPHYLNPPPQNPLTRIIAAIIALIVLVGSFMIGIAALLVVASIGIVLAVVIWFRVAWIKRRLKKAGVQFGTDTKAPDRDGHVIDAEYTVISEEEDRKEP